jgi:hypothetical protein
MGRELRNDSLSTAPLLQRLVNVFSDVFFDPNAKLSSVQ